MEFVQAYMDLVVTLKEYGIFSIPGALMILTWRWVYNHAHNNNRPWLMKYYGTALALLYLESGVNTWLFDYNLSWLQIGGPLILTGIHYLMVRDIGKHLGFKVKQKPNESKQ